MAGPFCEVCGYDLIGRAGETCPECGATEPDRQLAVKRRARRVRWILFAGLLVALSPFLLFGLFWAWYSVNLGLHVGYFGRLNRTLDALKSIPGASLVTFGANHDLSIEEISVEMRLGPDTTVRLFIPQDVDLASASAVMIPSINGTPLGSQGTHSDWSGPVFTLGPLGTLQSVTGEATSILDAIRHTGTIAAFVESRPIAEIQSKFEPASAPPGTVWMWILEAPTSPRSR